MATRKNAGQELATTPKQEIDVTRGEPTREGRYFTFAADIVESDEAVTVVADLPGVAPAGIDVDVRDSVLTIMGRVDDVPAAWRPIHTEYEVGGYLRQFNVGPAIDQEKITANMRDGVLTLVLKKADRLRPRKIEIRGN